MVDILSYAGDVLWIVVMSIIASTSRAALKRIPPGTRLPMQWGVSRKPTWRAPRDLAFAMMIGLPLLVGLLLLFAGRTGPDSPDEALMVFLVRAIVAPLMALIHLIWLRLALKTLEDEGALKP